MRKRTSNNSLPMTFFGGLLKNPNIIHSMCYWYCHWPLANIFFWLLYSWCWVRMQKEIYLVKSWQGMMICTERMVKVKTAYVIVWIMCFWRGREAENNNSVSEVKCVIGWQEQCKAGDQMFLLPEKIWKDKRQKMILRQVQSSWWKVFVITVSFLALENGHFKSSCRS